MNSLAAELRTTLVDVTELNIDHTLDVITFNHGTKWWIINVTAQFPDIPAKVYYKPHKDSSNRYDVVFFKETESDPRDLNTPKLIIQAINCNCFCLECNYMQGQY